MRLLCTSALITNTRCSALNKNMHLVRTLSQAKGGGAKHSGRNKSYVFDYKTPKSARIKAFKHAIYQFAIGKGKFNFSPLEVNLIACLVHGLKGAEKKNPVDSLQAKVLLLNKLLLTQRLTDKDIMEGINTVVGPVNVAIPRDITTQEEKQKFELQRRKSENIDLHPSRKVRVEELLHSLNIDTNTHEDIYKKISLYLQKNEESRKLVAASQHNHVDIDLNSLKGYLQNVENKAHQKNAVNKQKAIQNRTYEWSTDSFSEAVPLTAGNILFKRRPTRLLKRLKNRISILFNVNNVGKKVGTDNKIQKKKKVLLYSLQDNKDITMSNSFDYGVFNINFTDLFGVINASGYPPESVLNQVNDIELKGWKCVGNLYDNNKIIVFQSSIPFSDGQETDKRAPTARKTLFISIAALLTSFYAYYRYRLSPREEPKVDSSSCT